MLPKYHESIREGSLPEIRKYCDGRELSRLGAFPSGRELRIEVTLPRRLGDAGVVLRLFPDGGIIATSPFRFPTAAGVGTSIR